MLAGLSFEASIGLARDPTSSLASEDDGDEEVVEEAEERGLWKIGWRWADRLLDWLYPREGADGWWINGIMGGGGESEEVEEGYMVSGRMGDLKVSRLGRGGPRSMRTNRVRRGAREML